MTLGVGTQVYVSTASPVLVVGTSYTKQELKEALAGAVGEILWDESGHKKLEDLWKGLAATQFEADLIHDVLGQHAAVEDWRVGEAFAEAYLKQQRRCEFPWPSGRDLKNSSASQAGADLVGFQNLDDGPRLAFGEVKTSSQKSWPPSVVTGRHGMQRQLEDLRDRAPVKNQLLKYLGFHANGATWSDTYRAASKRYFADVTDVSLFGVLVRDVSPKIEDVAGRTQKLDNGHLRATSIELCAIYLPTASIRTLATRATRARRRKRQ